ncbi:MAG: aminoacyl-histidine dipeptidase [Proteobacteria bacterium]|nr:aminoacyl-histidine dipeptidase [Pseudomonadota bacterium]
MNLLEPTIVWKHFQTLCTIPRPSKQEDAIRDHIEAWARRRKLFTDVDEAGNLLIRKAASAGHEQRPGVVMQAHLDMVCQALDPGAGGAPHNFSRDPIRTEQRDGWLHALNTTLGADNGLGVALALGALEDETLAHGPLEVLLTVDEEAGMSGAHGLRPGWLQSRLMMNLDTEAWGEFFLGCAGGCDVHVHRAVTREPLPDGYRAIEIAVGGLRGGHSGCDIHLGLGNANRLLVAALREIERELAGELRLVTLSGGTARNALPRDAKACVAIPAPAHSRVETLVAHLQKKFRQELAGKDDGLTLSCHEAEADRVLIRGDQDALLAALEASPYGVYSMSEDFPGVVASSNNLGVVDLDDARFSAHLMVRSLREAGLQELAEKIAVVWRDKQCQVRIDGHYPGWTPDPASPLLALCQGVFRDEFASDASVQVIHAGLECGIINAKYPDMDTVSFGPTIRGAHAPGERVEI